jgi:hypothetical protein
MYVVCRCAVFAHILRDLFVSSGRGKMEAEQNDRMS